MFLSNVPRKICEIFFIDFIVWWIIVDDIITQGFIISLRKQLRAILVKFA